jgi:colanic acid biosynthesis glycosyl transferase WcaI
MKVVLISHAFPPDMGAASSRTMNIAKALLINGTEVDVIVGRPYYPNGVVPKEYWRKFSTKEKHGEINALRVWIPALPTKGLWRRFIIYLCFEISYALALIRYFSTKEVGSIYYISPYSLSLFSLPALLFGKLKGCKVILDVHDAWPEVVLEVGNLHSKTIERILGAMTWISVRLTDRITIAAESMGERLQKTTLLPLTVDSEFFKPMRHQTNPKLVVGYSGILGRRYDFDTILGASRILNRDIIFKIRGVGEMENHINNNREHSVLLQTQTLSPNELVEWLNSTDILLCPLLPSSEAEKSSVPLKLLEYMAVGKPVIVSDVGNVGALVKEANAGYVVPCSNPKALATAIMDLAYREDLRMEFGENGRWFVEKHYSLSSMAERLRN